MDFFDDVVFQQKQLQLTRSLDSSILTSTDCYLLTLPAELIDQICSFLEPRDLDTIGHTCRNLRNHSLKDLNWHRHIQNSVPGVDITHSKPCKSFRELYFAHDPHWFVPRHKIWVSDLAFTGKVIISRYDPDRGCIEAFRLVAERDLLEYESWEHDAEVLIHSFEPRVKLHLDMPVLQLEAHTLEKAMIDHPTSVNRGRAHRETPMAVLSRSGTFSNFFLAREVEYRRGMQVWPPPSIPSSHHVRNHSQSGFRGAGHKPQHRHEVSDHAFRLRKWVRLNGFLAGGPEANGTHSMEDVQTFATIDEKLYTPTPEYPWRGIFVGDYSGHGCEFLLMHQPEHTPYREHELDRRCGESNEEYELRIGDPLIHRGSIEAIKLTGDPNVPRGEYTFIADDIGPEAYVRTADEERFKKARIVRSRGHIAERFFRAGMFPNRPIIPINAHIL